MERTISSEERIRRAEEIYRKRRSNDNIRIYSNKNERINSKQNIIKKMILQMLICLMIYFIIYLIKNSNYIFSQDFMQKANQFLSQDVNVQELYTRSLEYWNGLVNKINVTDNQIAENVVSNQTTENIVNNEIAVNQNIVTQEAVARIGRSK